MIRTALCLSMIVASGPAWSLSCLRPSVGTSTSEAVASEDTYRIVSGHFDFETVKAPQGSNPEDHSIPASFEGRTLTADGFTAPTSGEVTLRIGCSGPWCGSIEPGVETLAYLRQSADGWMLDVGACQKWTFREPTEAQLKTVVSCVRDGDCPAE